MRSKRDHHGYLQINHRDSPGLTDDEIRRFGSPIPPGQGNTNYEADILTCSHCQTLLIINPLRTRERGYCSSCDRYICDGCAFVLANGGVCKTFTEQADEH